MVLPKQETAVSEMIFWGEKGEYGPFTVQEDGWPNAGEVIRHYCQGRCIDEPVLNWPPW